MSEHANDYPSVDAPDAVSCDVDGAFHHSKRERGREEGRVSEGKSFFGSTMESKESEEKREEREEHLPGGQGGSCRLASMNGNPTFADMNHTVWHRLMQQSARFATLKRECGRDRR